MILYKKSFILKPTPSLDPCWVQGLECGAVPVPGLPLPLHLRAAGGAARLQPRACARVRAQRLPGPDGVGQLQRLRAGPPPAHPRPRLGLVPVLRGDQLPAVLRQALPLRGHLRRGGGQVVRMMMIVMMMVMMMVTGSWLSTGAPPTRAV